MTDGLTLPRPADGETALAAALAWIAASDQSDELFAPGLQPLDASGAADTLAEHLAAAGLPDWRDFIVAAAGPGQPLHLDQRLAWLMANTAVEVAVSVDAPGLFRTVDEFQKLGDVGDAALAAEVCRRIADAAKESVLLARLQTKLQELWESHYNERLRRYAEATVGHSLTSRDLWPRHDGMPLGDGWAHRVVATLWPKGYMAMLASFPAPFQHGFGSPLSPPDLDLITSLIRASPEVYSDEGMPLGPVAVFDLLEAVETHLASIAVQDMAAAEAGLGRVVDAVISRTDGDWIGRAWLQQIIWRDTLRRAGRAQADVAAQRALRDVLLVRLSDQITPLGEAAFDWIRREEPLWAVHRILSEASILEAHGDAVAAAEALASAVRQGLVTATGRAAGLVTDSPEATVVGRVLSQLPDLTLWFETLWRDTYEVREALSYPTQHNLDNPAYPALAWGLVGLNSSAGASVYQARLWKAIADAVFDTQRTDPNASLFNGAMPPITRVTVQLGAALADRAVVPVDDLAQFMADQLDPTTEHARLWQIARLAASGACYSITGRNEELRHIVPAENLCAPYVALICSVL